MPPGVLLPGRNIIAIRVSNARGRGGVVPDDQGMTLTVDSNKMSLAGQWKYQIEEVWEGGRRPEIATSVPIAQQYLMADEHGQRDAEAARAARAGGRTRRRTGWWGCAGWRPRPLPLLTVSLQSSPARTAT